MTKTYLRPTAFVDTPVGFDGQVARLAGGMSFFSAYEVIVVEGGKRMSSKLMPIDRMEDHPLVARITAPRPPLVLGARTIRLDQPQVMGILNMTPDSFSDDGRYGDDVEAAAAVGFAMETAGAAIIDVGGESTRPGAKPVWEGDEIKRTQPVIERLARGGATVSIDSRKASVMEAALLSGAVIVNDVSALCFDAQALALMARSACPVIIMHSPDAAKTLHDGPAAADPLITTYDWLDARMALRRWSMPESIARASLSIRASVSAKALQLTFRSLTVWPFSTVSAARSCSGQAASGLSGWTPMAVDEQMRCRTKHRSRHGSAGRLRSR